MPTQSKYQAFQNAFDLQVSSLKFLIDKRVVFYVLLSGLISLGLGLLFVFIVGYKAWASYREILLDWNKDNTFKAHFLLIIQELFPLIAILLVGFVLFKSLILIVNGPVFAKISEATEEIVTGKIMNEAPSLLAQLQRTIRMSFWSISRELMLTIPALFLHLVPGIGSIIFTIVVFLIQSYYAGANYMDFVLERNGYNYENSLRYLKEKNVQMIGLGTGFMLLLFVPVLGIIIAPTLCVISATRLFLIEKK